MSTKTSQNAAVTLFTSKIPAKDIQQKNRPDVIKSIGDRRIYPIYFYYLPSC